jgi:hypothetical protein
MQHLPTVFIVALAIGAGSQLWFIARAAYKLINAKPNTCTATETMDDIRGRSYIVLCALGILVFFLHITVTP